MKSYEEHLKNFKEHHRRLEAARAERRQLRNERYNLICKRRKEGVTLQVIADEIGVSRERIRQIISSGGDGPISFNRVCSCGNEFETPLTSQRLCGECKCEICGKQLSRVQAVSGTRYCCAIHDPDYKGAEYGATFRKVERGIYVRQYLVTNASVNDHHYVWVPGDGWKKFDSLEEAKEFRNEGKHHSGESSRIRQAVLSELAKGPARTDQVGEAIGVKPIVLGTYMRHMKGDGLIQSRKTERVGYKDRLVWELVP